MKVQKSAEVGRCRQQPEKKDAYIGKIIPNRVDSAQSIHIMAVVVRSFPVIRAIPEGGRQPQKCLTALGWSFPDREPLTIPAQATDQCIGHKTA